MVIDFGDSYEVPASTATTDTTSDETGKKKGRTVTVTTKDMQKRKNDVKGTKKTKKNLLKKQYGNFKAEGLETLEQTFNRLQLMHTIVWRNRSDLDTMSLDDLYNYLKVYESKVKNKSEPNTQNMGFISSTKHIRGYEDVNTASISTASTTVPTATANIGVASISQDTTCAYIASQSNGSQIKFKDINQIDKDDMEEMDIKWNMALLRMRADKFWKKTGKKISIQETDVAGFDKSKVECFNFHKMGYFARESKAPRSQDRGRRDNYRQGSKVEEHAPKVLMEIDGVGWDWSYMANDEENHALVADKEAPTEFALMAHICVESKVFDNSLCSKDCKKNTDSLNSKITDLTDKLFDAKNMIYHYKLGLTQVESILVEDKDRESNTVRKLETGLLEFKDDTVTDYSRHAPTVESSPDDAQNINPSDTEEASPNTISPKSFIKFVKANDSPSPTKSKIDKAEKAKKSFVKYAKQYRKPTKKPNVEGNKRNWNNLKSYQLGPNFVMKKNACFNCGDFNHLAYDYRKRVKKETSRSQNTTHKSFTPRPVVHKPYRPPMRPVRSNMNGAWPNIKSFNKPAHSYTNRPFQRTSAVRSQYRAPWVPTANRNFPLVNRKF
nr:hypothetical protein [Tanacetum cinerariifolium]